MSLLTIPVQCVVRMILLPFLYNKQIWMSYSKSLCSVWIKLRGVTDIICGLAILWKFYDENSFLNGKALNLKKFNPQKLRLYGIYHDGCWFERMNYSKKYGLSLERQYLSKHMHIGTKSLRLWLYYLSILLSHWRISIHQWTVSRTVSHGF